MNKQHTLKPSHALAFLTGLIALLILIGSASRPEAVVEPSPVAAATAKPQEPETPKSWQTVATLSGTNSKRGDTFRLSGAKARLTYTVSGQYPSAYVYVIEDGKSLDKNGGTAEVSGTSGGETRLIKSAGYYYIEVMGYGDWTVRVEEYK